MAHVLAAALMPVAVAATPTAANPAAASGDVSVVSYNVASTPQSGWGYWFHAYSGSITDTGRIVTGSVSTGLDDHIADYSDGKGLNSMSPP